MLEFNKKKSYRKFIYSPVTLFILCLVFLLLAKALFGVYGKERVSAGYLARQQTEYSKMKEREKELSDSVEYLKTEQGVEAEIRSKFRVVKEGESVAVIVDNDAPATTTSATTTPKTLFQKFLGFFGML